MYGPWQWEMASQCNAISHWLGAYTEWSLLVPVKDPWMIWGNRLIPKHNTTKCVLRIYRKTPSISRTKFENLNLSCILLQLSSLNPLKSGVKLRMKMWLEQRRQAMLQLHLSYQQFYCLLRCGLYKRFYGSSWVYCLLVIWMNQLFCAFAIEILQSCT